MANHIEGHRRIPARSLALAGLIIVGAAAEARFDFLRPIFHSQSVLAETSGDTPTPTVTGTATAIASLTATRTATVTSTATATVTPTVTATPTPAGVEQAGVRLVNLADKVDPAVVDVAKGAFKNTTGVAPHIFADPGGLLVGPDFGYTGSQNPYGANPKGWEAMYGSGGSIAPISPVTQEVIRWPGEADQNLPEGGFVFLSGGEMTVSIPKDGDQVVLRMPARAGHNYFFAARGLYADGKQDSDRNKTIKITDYKAGHLLVSMYPSRLASNTAFISEGQLIQDVATSHITNSNCGAEGCSTLTVVAYDHNTGALDIWDHKQDRPTADLGEALKKAQQSWTLSYRNWR